MQLKIARIGGFAARALRTARDGRVVAVFQRSMHIEAGGAMLCLCEPSIGNGPLNAVVGAIPGTDWIACAGAPGDAVRIDNEMLKLGTLRLDAQHAISWLPKAWPHPLIDDDLGRGLACVIEIAHVGAPDDGLARLALGLDDLENKTPMARIAVPRLQALGTWLRTSTRSESGVSIPDDVVALLGLGPGLTPSGDDVLCGVMVALHSVGLRHMALKLAMALGEVSGERTTRLSDDFLKAAAGGQGSELLHDVIHAILTGDAAELPSLVGRLGRVGHTSGWDALAGVVLAINACAAAYQPTRSP